MNDTRYRLLIVESSDIVVEGLKRLLGDERFEILGTLGGVQNLENRVRTLQPDVLVVNPSLLQYPGQLNPAQSLRPRMAVVALVYHYIEPQTLASFRTVLDINTPGNRVPQLIVDASDECSQRAAAVDTGSYELSDRETDVLVLVAKGMSSKEIADRLSISIHTVNTHRKNITHKTGIRSVAGLAVYATLHNLT